MCVFSGAAQCPAKCCAGTDPVACVRVSLRTASRHAGVRVCERTHVHMCICVVLCVCMCARARSLSCAWQRMGNLGSKRSFAGVLDGHASVDTGQQRVQLESHRKFAMPRATRSAEGTRRCRHGITRTPDAAQTSWIDKPSDWQARVLRVARKSRKLLAVKFC